MKAPVQHELDEAIMTTNHDNHHIQPVLNHEQSFSWIGMRSSLGRSDWDGRGWDGILSEPLVRYLVAVEPMKHAATFMSSHPNNHQE